jgi:hypothetical protein
MICSTAKPGAGGVRGIYLPPHISPLCPSLPATKKITSSKSFTMLFKSIPGSSLEVPQHRSPELYTSLHLLMERVVMISSALNVGKGGLPVSSLTCVVGVRFWGIWNGSSWFLTLPPAAMKASLRVVS